jgi:flagellar biosynthetic protein FliQ
MPQALAVDLIHRAVTMSLTVAAPLLLTALVVGTLVSLVQAVTQLQEQTLTFIPKLLALAAVLLLVLPWMLGQLAQYLATTLNALPTVGL